MIHTGRKYVRYPALLSVALTTGDGPTARAHAVSVTCRQTEQNRDYEIVMAQTDIDRLMRVSMLHQEHAQALDEVFAMWRRLRSDLARAVEPYRDSVRLSALAQSADRLIAESDAVERRIRAGLIPR